MGLVQSHLIQVLIVKTSIIVGIHAFCIVVQVLILPLNTSDVIDVSNPQEGEIFCVDKNFTDLNNPVVYFKWWSTKKNIIHTNVSLQSLVRKKWLFTLV